MMNIFSARHPDFDALSAWSDLTDLERASSHLTRHVSQCDECRSVVAAIHGLGQEGAFRAG